MKCQVCNANEAHVHVVDVAPPDSPDPAAPPAKLAEGPDGQGYELEERHVCEECAARMDLPTVPTKPGMGEIWKLLEQSAKRRHEESGVTCPHCGMTLAEFRAKGRLGCPHDYEVFREHLDPLLERIHNASAHIGRVPGGEVTTPYSEPAAEPAAGPSGGPPAAAVAPAAAPVDERTALEQALSEAVETEDYERAAELRDQLKGLGPASDTAQEL